MQSQPSIQVKEPAAAGHLIRRILVVVDPEKLGRLTPEDPLISRAIWLAQGVAADIELFCVSAEESTLTRLLKSRQSQANERIQTADSAATQLAELAVTVRAATGLTIRHDARWAKDEGGAIVQKATESRADIVLKSSERNGYLVGLLDHPDWTLIRQSPAHVWFVADTASAPRHLLAALGATDKTQLELAEENDQQVCQLASLLNRSHQVRASLLHLENQNRHTGQQRQALTDLANVFPLDPVSTNLIGSPARDAIPTFADAVDADLILMGASTLTRLDRLLRPVTEEPVLAKTSCDVVFLRPTDLSEPPLPAEPTVQGLPAVDVEQALTDPEIAFNHSPDKLAAEDRLSVQMRQRLLGIWEQDLKSALIAEDDGDPKAATTSQLLPAVQKAKASLASADEQSEHSHG